VSTHLENRNLAELLGYPRDSKLLIIHADDLGLSHSVNKAAIKAYSNHRITSGSIMVPCPCAIEIMNFFKDNTHYDVGIHLTLTAEWDSYKWGGVVTRDRISSLVDKEGNFYSSVDELGKVMKRTEAEIELKAQIEEVFSYGIKPTHIDSHMFAMFAKPELVEIYLNLSEEYNLPILLSRDHLQWLPAEIAKSWNSKIFILESLFSMDQNMINSEWFDSYQKGLGALKPGLNQMIVHIAFDNNEMQNICRGHDYFGSAWRQKDFNLIVSSEFKDFLNSNGIILITWGQIRDLMNTVSPM
jgi:predicted glycoside hydrolase/deacetylase ChbG (UPF0249 family)